VNIKSVLSKFPGNSLLICRAGNLISLFRCKKIPCTQGENRGFPRASRAWGSFHVGDGIISARNLDLWRRNGALDFGGYARHY